MAIGKVVVITRGGMDKESMEVFMSSVPKGWQTVFADMNDGDAKVTRELEDAEYIICSGTPLSTKVCRERQRVKTIQAGGTGYRASAAKVGYGE